jgi:hypothetical protein
MDEVRRVRVQVMGDPKVGVVTLSRLSREKARLVRQVARLARQRARLTKLHAELLRHRARELRGERPAPRYFARAFPDDSHLF